MGAARITFKPGGVTVQMKTGRVMISQKIGNVIVTQKYFEAPTVPLYDPVYQAWLDRADALGVTKPSDPEKAIQNQFILDLRANGLLARMKFGNLFGYGSLGFGNIDIPQPTKSNAPTGSVLYSQGNGVKSDGASFLTAPFTAKEYAGIENNSSFITYISESNLVGANIGAFQISDAAKLVYLAPLANGSTTTLYEIYTGNFENVLPNTDHKGMYTLVPGTGPNGYIYKDGVKRNLAFASGVPTNNNSLLLLRDTIFGAFYQKYMGAMFVFDKFVDADELAFRTAFNTYKTSIGMP
jgi:hypothetical protein